MDSWYATNKLMLYIDDLGKYYCPLKHRNQPASGHFCDNACRTPFMPYATVERYAKLGGVEYRLFASSNNQKVHAVVACIQHSAAPPNFPHLLNHGRGI